MQKGLFIAVYGVNSIGKSTHCRILSDRLKRAGYEVITLKYPIYNLEPTGTQLNKILRGEHGQTVSEEELQTLFTQNRKDFEPTLEKYLAEGKIVVAEDYTGTGIAWGMAKGLSQDFMENLNKDLKKEDFSLLITGHRDVRATEKHHIHEQNNDLLQKVSTILVQLGEKYKWNTILLQPTIPDTADLIWKTVKEFIDTRI